MLEPFSLPFFREGLMEILLLSVAAGLIGSWVILRGLAFYSHAIGTASFPGLVLADGVGFPAAVGAFGMAGVFTLFSGALARSKRTTSDGVTGLILVGSMAGGVILASDVFNSGANVDTLLFGSLLAIDSGDLLLAAAAAAVSILSLLLFSHHWLARGFDEASAPSVGSGSGAYDLALMAIVAFTVIAGLSAVGALLVAALMVVPAATVRMVTSRVTTLQAGSVILVAIEGTLGLWLSFKTDAPPGATIAMVSGVVFAIVAIGRQLRLRRIVAAAATLVVLGGIAAGCGDSGDDSGSDGLRVTATTTQVADFVSEVGGDRIDLTRILQPNTDPHDYEPRPSDVEAVVDASILFRSGGTLDEWGESLLADSGSSADLLDLSYGVPVVLGDGEDADPHWWHDPLNVAVAVQEVDAALASAAPDDAAYFKRNADAYLARIAKLNRQIETCVKKVPEGQRRIVTDHDAFGYFTNRYGIETVGTVIPALTTQAQPSAGDLADLEQTIRDEGVKAIFPESSVSPDLAEALARDTGVSTGYTLYGDTLGPEGSDGETWIGMMESNTDSVVLGMTGGSQRCGPDDG